MNSAAHPPRCPRCGSAVELDSPGGWCVRCALEHALASPRDEGGRALFLGDIPVAGEKLAYVGDYELLQVIAQGGMGIIYKAKQKSLDRIVALKMLLGGVHASPEFKRRFRHEAEIAAKLQHPGIVPIFDVGEYQGQPYFSMEYVEGANLENLLKESALSVKEAVDLVARVAEVVGFAHERGVLHRDLKPSNILLGSDQRPRVTDFGLARTLDNATGLTLTGAVLGTPGYMAPEQAQGRTRDITVAVDVWSLGVILYEMLGGRMPFHAETPLQTARLALEVEPTPLRLLNKGVDRDLETICLKCLEKNPAGRYPSALGLCEDLRRWQAHEPIQARPATTRARILKWAKRNPVGAIVVAFLLLSLLGFISTLAVHQHRLQAALGEALLREGEARAAQGRFAEAKRRTIESLSISHRGTPSRRKAELSLMEIFRSSPAPLLTLSGHQGRVFSVAVSGSRIFSGGEDGTIRVWSCPLGRQEMIWDAHSGGVTSLAVSPDDRFCVSGGADKKIRIWDARKLLLLETLTGHSDQISCLSFSQTDLFASVSRDRTIRIWRLPSGELTQVLAGAPPGTCAVALSPDGGQVVAVGPGSGISAWDLGSTPVLSRYHLDRDSQSIAYSPDGKELLIGDLHGVLTLNDCTILNALRKVAEAGHSINTVAFSRDGKTAFTGGRNGSIGLWNITLDRQEPLLIFAEHEEPVSSIAAFANGRWVVSGGADGTVRVWDTRLEHERQQYPRQHYTCSRAVFSPDGLLILSAGGDGGLKVWDVATTNCLREFVGHSGKVLDAVFSVDGRQALSAGGDGTVRLWDISQGKQVRSFETRQSAPQAGGNPPATADDADGDPNPAAVRPVRCIAVSPGGRLVVAGEAAVATEETLPGPGLGGLSLIHVWDAATGREVRRFGAHHSGVANVAFSPDGRELLSAGGDGTVRLWNVLDWRQIHAFQSDVEGVQSAAFMLRGSTCVSAGSQRTLKLCDLADGGELPSFSGLSSDATSLAVSADGLLLLAGLRDGGVTLWEAPTRHELHAFPSAQGGGAISSVAFSPRQNRALATTVDGGLELLDFDRGVTHLWFLPLVNGARAKLQADPHDAEALRTLAEWYEFRRVFGWAADVYSQVRTQGTTLPHLSFARCLWQSGNLERAAEEMAAAAENGEAPAYYLDLCRRAIARQIAHNAISRGPTAGPPEIVTPPGGSIVLQPGPSDGDDIWTGSYYSRALDGDTPGGGANDDRLRVGGEGDEYHSLLRFDLSQAPTNAAKAVLGFYCFRLLGGGAPMELDRIAAPWDWRNSGTGRDRDRLWWADKPRAIIWRTNELATPIQEQWYAIDITDLYNSWQAGAYPNHGLQLRPVLPNRNEHFNEFYSADYTNNPSLRPKLIVIPGK